MSDVGRNAKDKAVGLLVHYFRTAGVEPTHDSDFWSEMEELVEHVGDYVVARLDAREEDRAEAEDEMHDRIMDEIDPLGQG